MGGVLGKLSRTLSQLRKLELSKQRSLAKCKDEHLEESDRLKSATYNIQCKKLLEKLAYSFEENDATLHAMRYVQHDLVLHLERSLKRLKYNLDDESNYLDKLYLSGQPNPLLAKAYSIRTKNAFMELTGMLGDLRQLERNLYKKPNPNLAKRKFDSFLSNHQMYSLQRAVEKQQRGFLAHFTDSKPMNGVFKASSLVIPDKQTLTYQKALYFDHVTEKSKFHRQRGDYAILVPQYYEALYSIDDIHSVHLGDLYLNEDCEVLVPQHALDSISHTHVGRAKLIACRGDMKDAVKARVSQLSNFANVKYNPASLSYSLFHSASDQKMKSQVQKACNFFDRGGSINGLQHVMKATGNALFYAQQTLREC